MIDLPQPASHLREQYFKLIGEIDSSFENLTSERFQSVMRCGPGCADCCVRFSILPFEAALIADALRSESVQPGTAGEKCVMLFEDRCRIYTIRPILCRTQGVPIAYVDEEAGAIEVSACTLNFPDDYPLGQDDLLFMDEYNSRLAALNQEYCLQNGIEAGRRIALSDLVDRPSLD